MFKTIIIVLWFLVLSKFLLFWLWLWQIKEYRWKRFKDHFTTQAIKKILSSFWRFKRPKTTKKTAVLCLAGLLTEILIIYQIFPLKGGAFYTWLFLSIILVPIAVTLLIFIFQIPTIILKKILIKKAAQKRKGFRDLIVVAITGSYGKTSVKEFLSTMLSTKFRVLKTEKHINAEIGIAQTILKKLKPEHQIFVAEVGAYGRGDVKEICHMLGPQVGILSGINEQHLALFGSQENIVKAKFELIESLPENGTAILNGSSEKIKNEQAKINDYNKKLKDIIWCSSEAPADIWAENVIVDKNNISFGILAKDGDKADFKLNLLGKHNVENILLAAACAKKLGMALLEISLACKNIQVEQESMQKKQGISGLTVIDSTYSANPNGVLADLDYLKLYPGKKILVMPCLIELGKASKDVHEKIGVKIGEVCDLAIITTKDRFKELLQGAQKVGLGQDKIFLIEKPKKAFEKISQFTENGDAVLLESRVPPLLIKLLNSQ
ncbi:MAG: UDP-N-acetylmuramoyl-tripeptide--D-alanyl-D-alanine ligase [Candidatus Pacebacteria bacterium]|nr:UDP-N-acetylmuramoyl-tripeptide--D-alanyl-D-alanine ligase [Candidatus Paceibacterota bacterium]